MIRGEQLQIGDFVLYRGTPIRVECITKKKVGYHITPNDKRLYYARLHDVEPIEVTHELLEANGFKADVIFHQMVMRNESFSIEIFDEPRGGMYVFVQDNDFYPLGSRVFACLHQLQQACRMCGVEIEWKV